MMKDIDKDLSKSDVDFETSELIVTDMNSSLYVGKVNRLASCE